MKHKLIIAHRGGASSYPDTNAFHSFEKAVNSGADIIEFDIRRSIDNVYLVIHDHIINAIKVDFLTFEDVNRFLNGNILKLEDALMIAKGKIKIYIELKEKKYEIIIINIVRQYFKIEDFTIIAFNDSSIKKIKDTYPEIQVGLILGKQIHDAPLLSKISEIFPVKRIFNSKADIVLPNWKIAKFGVLSQIKSCNKPIIVWTLNSMRLINRFLHNDKVDGIITDNVRMALSLRRLVE